MGKEKSSGTTVVNQTTTPTATPEEKRMQQLELQQYEQTVGPQTQTQLAGLNLINQLLLGKTPQGELYQQISGISPQAIGAQATELTRQSLPQFQGSGLMDSGIMQREIARSIANQLLFPAEQFNIGSKQNLLNLALSGQAQVQQPIQAGTNILANQLAGLRSVNQQGTTTETKSGMNPFVKSFQSSLGQSLGQGSWGSAWKPR